MGVRSRLGHGCNGGIYYGIGQAYMYPYTFTYIYVTHKIMVYFTATTGVGA